MSSHHDPGCAAINTTGSDASVASLVSTSLPSAPTDIAMEDWDILFRAVKERLSLLGSERLAETPEPPARDTVKRLQACVLECVEALDQLHAAQRSQFGQRQQLPREVFEVTTARVASHTPLAGAEAAEPRTG